MMNYFARRILTLGSIASNLLVSSAGCFVFVRGFRQVALEREGSEPEQSDLADGLPSKPLAGAGAALFLTAFVASEAAVMLRALYR
jgi:hypothetical protein